MKIKINRKFFTEKSTIGEMYINDSLVKECYTLEDKVRGPGEAQVSGATAIPDGNYKVIIDFSNRFQVMMPHVLNVAGGNLMFSGKNINDCGIRIHCGNTDKDTLGCILIGQTYTTDFIGNSRLAYEAFFPKLQTALQRGEVVTLELVNNR
jgi:hypothetical protein